MLISVSDDNRWHVLAMHQWSQSIQTSTEIIFMFDFQLYKHNKKSHFSACHPNNLRNNNRYWLVLYVQSIIKKWENTCNKSMLAKWPQSISLTVSVWGQCLWISIYACSDKFFSSYCICDFPAYSTTLNFFLALCTVLNAFSLRLFFCFNVFKMSLG